MRQCILIDRRKDCHFLVFFAVCKARRAATHSTSQSGILNMTTTTLGRSLLRTWLLRPLLSASIINARHDAVECFTLSENVLTATKMHGHLKGMRNIPKVVKNIKVGKGVVSDWSGLVKVGLVKGCWL